MIDWSVPNENYYHHGLDRAAIFTGDSGPVRWMGFTGMEEATEAGATTMLYRDGVVYLGDVDANDFKGKITALTYPREFAACAGIPEAADGFYVDNQKPTQFDLTYRALVGSGLSGDEFGYEIHLVYNCMASINTRTRRTHTEEKELVEFAFDIVCTPIRLSGYRPTAHYVIDTRFTSEEKVAQLETMLYEGTTMPRPADIYELLDLGGMIRVTRYDSEGTYKIEAPYDWLRKLPNGRFEVDNINAYPLTSGRFQIADGDNTEVIVA